MKSNACQRARAAAPKIVSLLILLVPLLAAAQSLSLSNGIATYPALTNTTVTMTGRCELRVTAAANPISGCLINLNSADAWFFLPNIRPSVVASTYLSQVRVNGATAVSDSNVRVAQYDLGTVVIPHTSSYQALQAFSGPSFLGASNTFSLYTYYKDSGLGALNDTISSFRLKHGYMATFAQNANGTGVSKTYVAQDGDLDVSVLPTNLDNSISFVRVFPWRWSGKKGWAGGVEPLVDPLWSYDWDNSTTSTSDTEYVPMRHDLNWNAYANINNKQKSTHALGFNEPDQANQANMTVATAIAQWPNLLASGLRLGSPSPSDASVGLTWLYDFMAQADALKYRVDFVPVHFYKGGWTATQFTNWCHDIHVATGRPIWVTEFNNGANWTCCEPTPASQATIINSFISALDNAPYVERYSIYNWVGTNRAMVTGGALTPAGVVYHDHASPLAYTQVLPAGGARSVAQFSFNGNAWDGSGQGNSGFVQGNPAYTTGTNGQAMNFDGVNTFVQLPGIIGDSVDFTFAAWVYWNGGANFQRLFDFGNGTGQYLFLTPNSGGTLRFAIKNGGSEQIVESAALTPGQWTHVALTLGGTTGTLFVNGAAVATNPAITIDPIAVNTSANYLGRSQFAADPLFSGRLDEVLITDSALTAAQIAALQTNLPPQFTNSIFARDSASEGQAYSNSVAGSATDPNGDALTYGKANGPAWLTVAGDGTLGGTPGVSNRGTNTFTVSVTDAAGMSAFALLNLYVNTQSNVMARYDFENNTLSSVGTAHGVLTGSASYVAGHTAQAIGLDGAANFITMPAGLADSDGLTLAAWVNWNGGASFQRIFDLGNSTSQYLFLTPSSGSGTLRFAILNGGTEQFVETSALAVGSWQHVAFTLNGNTGKLYVNGTLAATSTGFTVTPSSFKPTVNYLGKSQFAADPLFSGKMDEVFIANYALSAAQISLLATNHAPAFTNSAFARPGATNGVFYTNTLAGAATDADAGGALNFSKSSGPAWLTVAGSGALTGTPTPVDVGTNTFTMSVNDASGMSAAATVTIFVADAPNPIVTLTNSDALGSSSFITASNWDSGAPPSAFGDYNTSSNALRTPADTSDYTFAGNSLTFPPNATATGSMIFKGGGTRTYTFNRLFPSGGLVRSGSGSGDTCILGGSITLIDGTTSTIQADQSPFVLAAPVNGGGSLKTSGAYGTTLSGVNTYSGDTLVTANTLKVNAGPVLYLSFDSASGTTVTNNGSGGSLMNGTLTGAGATIVAGGRYGKALSVNGTAAYVLVTNKVAALDCTSGGAAWTYALWLKTATAGAKFGYQGSGSWNATAQTTFYFNANSTAAGGTKVGGVRFADNWLTGTTNVNDNAWHFITIAVGGGYKKIYVDGILDAQTGTTGWAAAGSATASQFWIGGSPDTGDGTAYLNGLIDEVYVFNRALSQTEVQNLMTVTNAVVAGLDRSLSPASLVNISGGAKLDLNGSTQVVPGVIGSGTVDTTVVGAAATLVISNTADYTFNGVLANTGGALSLNKMAAGTFTLTGNHNYTGPTTVSAGALLVNGLLPASAVTVSGTGILGGNGSLGGAVIVQSGGTLAPGTSIGKLTVSNSLTLQPGSQALMEISHSLLTNDVLRVTGILNCGGTLTVSNLAGTLAAGDSFTLFQAGSISSTFASYSLPTLNPGLGWNTTGLTNGVLSVVQTVNPNSTNLTASVAGGTLQLSWPADHTGWRVQAQTNSLDAGLGTTWFDVAGSATTNLIVVPMDAANPTVFYRMIFP